MDEILILPAGEDVGNLVFNFFDGPADAYNNDATSSSTITSSQTNCIRRFLATGPSPISSGDSEHDGSALVAARLLLLDLFDETEDGMAFSLLLRCNR